MQPSPPRATLFPYTTLFRSEIAAREVSDATAQTMGLGYAPPGRDGLVQAMRTQGFTQATLVRAGLAFQRDRKSTRLNSSHSQISYAVFCLKKKNIKTMADNY